jgi:MFS family permease
MHRALYKKDIHPLLSAEMALRALVAARFVSLAGTSMTVVSLPWFVLTTTGSTARMGLVVAFQTIPALVLGVPAGSLVAALGARRTLIVSDALRAPLLAAVPVLHAAGVLSFPLLLVLVTAIGVFTVPYTAAAGSVLPELVGEDEGEVARATAALQVSVQTTRVIGPILAGLLIPFIGAANLLYLDAASYAASALILATFVHAGRALARDRRRRGVLVGVRAIRADPLLTAILVAALFAHIGLAALVTSLPALAYAHFHDAKAAGLLFAADAAGSVAGGFAALWLARRTNQLRLGVVGFMLMSIAICPLAGMPPYPVAVAALLCFGFGSPLGVSPISAVLTLRPPAEIRPQVMSAFFAITSAGIPFGAAVTGYVLERGGFRITYAATAVLLGTATVLLAAGLRRITAVEAVPAVTPSS